MTEYGRIAEDFLYPPPTLADRLRSFATASPFIPYSAPVYVPAFDVSKWQLVVDYKAAYAGGYRLVIIKCSEGLVVDPYFTANWQAALGAGFRVMVYHFFRSNVQALDQAHFALETIKPLVDAGAKIAVWGDLETADGMPNSTRKPAFFSFLDAIHQEGFPTGPYSSNNYWPALMDSATLPPQHSFWIAHWTMALNPTIPKGITEGQARLWQDAVYPTYSWGRPVPGVVKAVDNDRWRGDLTSLDLFLGYTSPEPTDAQKLQILWREAGEAGWDLQL